MRYSRYGEPQVALLHPPGQIELDRKLVAEHRRRPHRRRSGRCQFLAQPRGQRHHLRGRRRRIRVVDAHLRAGGRGLEHELRAQPRGVRRQQFERGHLAAAGGRPPAQRPLIGNGHAMVFEAPPEPHPVHGRRRLPVRRLLVVVAFGGGRRRQPKLAGRRGPGAPARPRVVPRCRARPLYRGIRRRVAEILLAGDGHRRVRPLRDAQRHRGARHADQPPPPRPLDLLRPTFTSVRHSALLLVLATAGRTVTCLQMFFLRFLRLAPDIFSSWVVGAPGTRWSGGWGDPHHARAGRARAPHRASTATRPPRRCGARAVHARAWCGSNTVPSRSIAQATYSRRSATVRSARWWPWPRSRSARYFASLTGSFRSAVFAQW